MFELKFSKELNNKKVRTRFEEDIEPDDVLLDSLAQKEEEEIGVTEKKFEVPLSKNSLWFFLILNLFLILVLFIRTFQFQILDNQKFLAQAKENKFIISSIKAERGIIYDKNLNQLVFNQPSFDLILDKGSLPKEENEKNRVLKEVSEIIEKDIEELKNKIENEKDQQILILDNLDHQTLIALETRKNELPGFQTEKNSIRQYQDSETFAHLVGYTGKIKSEEYRAAPEQYSISDYVGRSGIEKSYEEVLRVIPGKVQTERDALGNIISKEITSLPESGKSLVLWLDSDLQKKITEELEITLKDIGAKKGAAVALDPKTGGVLSLVSIPSFDNNIFNKGADPAELEKLLQSSQEPLFDRAISGTYPTGSTIKPLIASAALEEKIISPNKKINDDKGFITIPNPWNPDQPTIKRDWSIHGWTDMRKAIAESCDVYFYTIGGGYEDQQGLGVAKIKKYLDLFGWEAKTGIDLPGETAGFVPSKDWKKSTLGESWVDGDTYNLAIGQGFIKITPLEVATAFSAIANGGKLLEPQVVQKIIDNDKNVIEESQPKIIRDNFIDPQNLKVAREGMRWAVTGENSPKASSITLNSLPISVAAKTGTAELGNNHYDNWVTVFAPYDDPQIVLTIVLEDVEKLQAAALPVAKEVLNWYFTR
jgi:penicillin-binding protein 2